MIEMLATKNKTEVPTRMETGLLMPTNPIMESARSSVRQSCSALSGKDLRE
jgi:hypothetical protein